MNLKTIISLTHLPDEVEREELKPLPQPPLSNLRQKIKEAMIPLLIQIFHLRQAHVEKMAAAQQETNIVKKLYALKKDLNHLSLWCSSCLTQIDKALSPPQPQRPKQCSASKKSSNLKFSLLHVAEDYTNSSTNILERLKSREKSAQKTNKHLFFPRSLRKVFSLAFCRNPRP